MNVNEIAEHYKHKHELDPDFCGGYSIKKHREEIESMLVLSESETVLDYGCGKAKHWKENHPSFDLTLFDPYIEEYSTLPPWGFDMVVCCDVMEHVPVEEEKRVLRHIFALAEKFVFLAISIKPAKKRFPDGTNLHINLKTLMEWDAIIKECNPRSIPYYLTEGY